MSFVPLHKVIEAEIKRINEMHNYPEPGALLSLLQQRLQAGSRLEMRHDGDDTLVSFRLPGVHLLSQQGKTKSPRGRQPTPAVKYKEGVDARVLKALEQNDEILVLPLYDTHNCTVGGVPVELFRTKRLREQGAMYQDFVGRLCVFALPGLKMAFDGHVHLITHCPARNISPNLQTDLCWIETEYVPIYGWFSEAQRKEQHFHVTMQHGRCTMVGIGNPAVYDDCIGIGNQYPDGKNLGIVGPWEQGGQLLSRFPIPFGPTK